MAKNLVLHEHGDSDGLTIDVTEADQVWEALMDISIWTVQFRLKRQNGLLLYQGVLRCERLLHWVRCAPARDTPSLRSSLNGRVSRRAPLLPAIERGRTQWQCGIAEKELQSADRKPVPSLPPR